MSLLVWNCQGLGNPWIVKGLGDLLRDHKPTLVFLVETKCYVSQVESNGRDLVVFMESWMSGREMKLGEKEGGPMRAEWQIRNFRNCLSECELHDLSFQGLIFTWCNNQQEPNTVRERFDRVFSNMDWSQLFPDSRVQHVQSPYSDHSLLMVELRANATREVLTGHMQFCIEASWLQEVDYEAMVTRAWNSPVCSHSNNSTSGKDLGC
ncbi:UNVERIFIED_CONTAM: hypothetical protein Slati_2699900 [Sesamum latifolium]|uniref:Endonuclease/exonuclease/phosphatase domain-containing protein n=1 Tax=Sesamum latifolium TaxID=2727402 RepID=A0AAW2VXL8_9LAMI